MSDLRPRSCQAGFSLVEVMVAVTISLILLGGAVTMLVSSKQTYQVTEQQARIQENARFALEFIARDIRQAGYFGCLENFAKLANQITGATGGSLLDTGTSIAGLNNYAASSDQWYPGNNTTMPAGIIVGTDAITLRYLDPITASTVSASMATVAAPVVMTAATNLNLAVGDIVGVSDCDNADIFQVSSVTVAGGATTVAHGTGGTPGNTSANLNKTYDQTAATLHRLASVVYYIGTGASGRPALFRGAIPATGDRSVMAAQELIEGIESLQILYGKDTDGDNVPDFYLTAGQTATSPLTTATNWDSVVNVRIGILVASVDEYGNNTDTNARTVLDQTIAAANDRRSRRVFTTTVNLRNKAE